MSDHDALNDLSRKIVNAISSYTCFPLPILKAQSKRLGKTPSTLIKEDLPELAEYISKSIGDFSNPLKAQDVKKALLALI